MERALASNAGPEILRLLTPSASLQPRAGEWELLLNRAKEEASAAGQPAGAISSPPTAAQKAERAVKLAHLGARQALLAELMVRDNVEFCTGPAFWEPRVGGPPCPTLVGAISRTRQTIPRTVQFRVTPVHENWTHRLPPTELGGNFGGWTMGLGPLVLIRRLRLRPQGRHRPVIPKIGFSGASVSLPGAGASGYSLVPEAVGALA